jgi:ligand-binding SRPBCC domain-containing protein
MSEHFLRRELWIPQPRSTVFEFFTQASNLERITPPWVRFRVLTPGKIVMQPGALIEYQLRIRGVSARWLTEITQWDPPCEFTDVQRKGPYKTWRHNHRFIEEAGGTRMVDEVRYELPLGLLGDLAHRFMVRGDVERIFAYRNACIPEIIK